MLVETKDFCYAMKSVVKPFDLIETKGFHYAMKLVVSSDHYFCILR